MVASAIVLTSCGGASRPTALSAGAGRSVPPAITPGPGGPTVAAQVTFAAPAAPPAAPAVVPAAVAAPASAVLLRYVAPVKVRVVTYRRVTYRRYRPRRVVVRRRIRVRPPVPAPVRVGNPNDPMWQCIIWRESRGNPRAVNRSSGAGGLFQFLPSSWRAYGGTGLPENATVAEQWRIALNAYVRSGWAPWGGRC